MKIKIDRNFTVDIINYLAVSSLEELGQLEPTEKEIVSLEKVIKESIKNSLSCYQQKLSGAKVKFA